MTEPVEFRYRAFLSYSHADTRWAKRLHRRLETFRIDKDLVGRATGEGTIIPKTLRPVFRDREDFTAGQALGGQTLSALDVSAAMIVICSPASAKSHYVNEEIRLYRSRHPERPVIPVIVNGRPGHPELECFPPALRFAIDTDGNITDTPEEHLAADVREDGDGFDLAVAKVVARLLLLETDNVFRRAERARRRTAAIRNSIIATLALLAAMAGGSAAYAWQQLKTNEAFLEATLNRATDIVNTAVEHAQKFNVPRAATLQLLTRAEGLFDDMARLGRPTEALQRQKAWMLIQFSRNYAVLGDTTKWRERAGEAHRIMTALGAGKPDDQQTQYDLATAIFEYADALMAQGLFDEAMRPYLQAYELAYRFTQNLPGNTYWQRTLFIALRNVGRVQHAKGDLDSALISYRGSLAVAERLAKANPKDQELERSVAVAHNIVGDVLFEQGEYDEAETSFQNYAVIAEWFSMLNPENSGSQLDFAVAHSRIGDVHAQRKRYDDAVDSYRKGLEIMQRLVALDPTSTSWQRDTVVLHVKIGDARTEQKDTAAARTSYQAAFGISERLSRADSKNVIWQRDLSLVHGKIGRLHHIADERDAALRRYREGRAIVAQLLTTAPDNAMWKKDVEWFDELLAMLKK